MIQRRVIRLLDEIARPPEYMRRQSYEVESLTTLVQDDPQAVEAALLSALPERLLHARELPDLLRWAVAIDRLLPDSARDLLPVVLGVSKGLMSAQRTLLDLKLHTWRMPFGWDTEDLYIATSTAQAAQIAGIWHGLGVLAVLPVGYEPERAVWLRRLERHAADQPDSWAQSLAWILAVGPSLDSLDVAMTLALIELHPQVADAVRRLASTSSGRSGLRAEGIDAIATGADPAGAQEWILDAAATLLDQRRHQFPRPLEAPSATWLSDQDAESLLRGASRHAVEEFGDVVAAEGAAEEEGLTQNLLSLLAKHLGMVNPTLHVAVPAGQVPSVRVERRTVPKSEEKTIGADLGVVITVELPAHAQVRYGDLVQVKKSKLLRDPRQYSTVRADSWTVDVAQLEGLLAHSATAVYWLIAEGGGIHVVPAKMLLGLRGGRGKPGAGSFTVRYRDIRHAAITLGQYLCDVLLGMWTGSTHPATLAIADGSDSRTNPRNLLSITVQIARQG